MNARPAPQFRAPLSAWALALALVVSAGVWVATTSASQKLLGVVGGAVFAVTEFTFFLLTIEDDQRGTVTLAPRTFPNRRGHTTWTQFAVNVLFLPYALRAYVLLTAQNPVAVALFFPLCVWAIEVVEGHYLIALIGRNPAWYYYGADARLRGTIKLSYVWYWLGGGCVVACALPWLTEALK
jgi:hypothetical protein